MPNSSLNLSAIDITTGPNPLYTILWMHGLGADGNDFVPVIQALDLPTIPIRFLFPHAPQQPVTINNGHVMRAWYDIQHTDFIKQEDENGLRRSQQSILALIERENQRGIPTERIVLAGFSQGAVMALYVGLRHTKKLAGIMALSGYIALPHKIEQEAHTANQMTSIFMAHGNYDDVVPINLAQTSLQLLHKYNYSVSWHEYLIAHTLCDEELSDISCWLGTMLKAI